MLKKQEIEQNTNLFFHYGSEEDLFSEFYYPDEIVTENEGNVEVLSILPALSSKTI